MVSTILKILKFRKLLFSITEIQTFPVESCINSTEPVLTAENTATALPPLPQFW